MVLQFRFQHKGQQLVFMFSENKNQYYDFGVQL